jgi:hypothetical protein
LITTAKDVEDVAPVETNQEIKVDPEQKVVR